MIFCYLAFYTTRSEWVHEFMQLQAANAAMQGAATPTFA